MPLRKFSRQSSTLLDRLPQNSSSAPSRRYTKPKKREPRPSTLTSHNSVIIPSKHINPLPRVDELAIEENESRGEE